MHAWVYANACHLTLVHYEGAAEHISTFKASIPADNQKANIGFALLCQKTFHGEKHARTL